MKESSVPVVALTLRIYRLLARSFPQEFRNAYGEELVETAEDSIALVWKRHGILGLFRLVADITRRVPAEHFSELVRDVRYGLRKLVRSPGFALVAMLSVSIGIFAGTAFYSELNGTILRNVPVVSHPDELLALKQPISYPTYKRFAEQKDLFSSTAAYVAPVPFSVPLGGQTQRIWGHLVTPSYFSTLGVQTYLGRVFDKRDKQLNESLPVVVSYRFWTNYLGSDPNVIGKTLRVNGKACTIVGVGPKKFLGASPMMFIADLWIPLAAGRQVAPELADNALDRPQLTIFQLIARLKPGVTASHVEEKLDGIFHQALKDFGDERFDRPGRLVWSASGGKLVPTREQNRAFLTLLPTFVITLILLIACSNVANMTLARALDRRREMAVRLALGASRVRLIRQLLTESMLVAVGAGIIGFTVAVWLMHLLSQLQLPHAMPVDFNVEVDLQVLVFTICLTALSGLAFGLLPALQATRPQLTPALKEGGNVILRKYRRLGVRNLLVTFQMAGSLTLLLITAYIVVGTEKTMLNAVGFDPKNVQLISVDPIRDGYSSAQAESFYPRLLERVKNLPGVVSATWTEAIPMQPSGHSAFFARGEDGGKQLHYATKYIVGTDYFQTTEIALVRGRTFKKQDETAPMRPIIVSQRLAEEIWKNKDPVGQTIEISTEKGTDFIFMQSSSLDYRSTTKATSESYEIVGVARDVLESPMERPGPAIYLPMLPIDFVQPTFQGTTLMLRTAPGIDAAGQVRRLISSIDPNLTTFNARMMPDWIDQFMFIVNIGVWSYGSMGAFGLILATVGLAGVTAYSVTRRTHEIGLRMALGARTSHVLWLIMGEGAVLMSLGTGLGLLLAWGALRVLSGSFDPVARAIVDSKSDIRILLGSVTILGLVALSACYLPARRSISIDPVDALRQE
jgi:putative ABC transport system permease protein